MSKIAAHYTELTESGRLEKDSYAPEVELPADYQRSIDRDYADKDWYKAEDKEFKNVDKPVF